MISKEILGVITFVAISFYFFKRKAIKTTNTKSIFNSLKPLFTKSEELFPNIYQYILMLGNNKHFSWLYCVLTLKKDFSVFEWFMSNQDEHVILTGSLTSIRPNFFIIKQGTVMKHIGLQYSRKDSINSGKKYKIYGVTSNKVQEFVEKYEVMTFYCTYIPEIVTEGHKFVSQVYLKCKLDNFIESNLAIDFYNIFSETVDENKKKFEINKKRYLAEVEELKKYNNMSLFDKVMLEAKKRR